MERKRKYLPLQAEAASPFGQVISYLQRLYTKPQLPVQSLLEAVFLPFIVPRTDPDYRAIALRGVHHCEALARLLREYAELPAASSTSASGTAVESDKNLSSPEEQRRVPLETYGQTTSPPVAAEPSPLEERVGSVEPERGEDDWAELEQLNRQLGVNFDI